MTRITAKGRLGLAVAVTLFVASPAGAQVVSEQRIPVRKDQITVRESTGDVELANARIEELTTTAAALRQRIMDLENANATLTARSDAIERQVEALTASLRMVETDLANTRQQLAAAIATTDALQGTVGDLQRSLYSLRNGSLFGHSGFYMGLGTGAGMVTGAMRDAGYATGVNIVMPIGWSKPGVLLGIRTELGLQAFEGRTRGGFFNPDPMVLTGTAMLTLNLPLNQAKTNLFYLMGGGGAYRFRDIGAGSALNDRFDGTATHVTKFGVTGGAGLEVHVLGATALFVEVPVTNIFADRGAAGDSRDLRWVSMVAGVTLR